MTHKAYHGKQMASQHLHPYYPIPTIHNFPIEQLHQTNLKPGEWKEYMKNEIKAAEHKSTFEKHKVIGFVPRALFDVKPQSYCPRILTIGPLYQNLEPSPIDRCKALCAKKFMERHKIPDLERLMKELIPEPRELRDIYSGLPSYDFESLQLLVTVDTVFIHEFFLFLREDCPHSQDKDSGYLYTFMNNDITRSQIWRDLLLIGNQIPMSFLKKLINIPKKSPNFTENNLLNLLDYFVSVNNPFLMSKFNEKQGKEGDTHLSHPKCKGNNETEPTHGGKTLLDCEHLLDCLYVSCTQEESPEHSTEPQISTDPGNSMNRSRCLQLTDILPRGWKKTKNHGGRLHPASELIKAGIRFKVCEGNTSVIKYHKSKSQLDLPRLVVYDGTEDILRNLIAHEQISKEGGKSSKEGSCEICGYAIIMDSLIDTQEDIAILTRAKVLENHLGSDERLVQMWNDMCINISEESYDRIWGSMMKDIMEHYRIRWRVMCVEFRAKFCSRPWLWMSAIAGTILLILSLLQTIYTLLGFYKNT